MNTLMWSHPLTSAQLDSLSSFWSASADSDGQCVVVEPVCKKLACGETGVGALADIGDITSRVKQLLPKSTLKGK